MILLLVRSTVKNSIFHYATDDGNKGIILSDLVCLISYAYGMEVCMYVMCVYVCMYVCIYL